MSGLTLAGVVVSYGPEQVIRGLDLEIATGSWTCLIGPNGAGKSTLLGAISGTLAYNGSVTMDQVELRELSTRRRARLTALVPQRPAVPAAMTVTDYVLMGRTPYISYLGSESGHDLEVVLDSLERVELIPFAGRNLGSLSGGELQRAVLARALAQEAPLLLLDEPTSALDIGHQQQALELVDALRAERGLTVVSAMHDLTLAGQYAERLALLGEGRIVAEGPPAEVLTSERIGEHYRAEVVVIPDGTGGLLVAPRRRK